MLPKNFPYRRAKRRTEAEERDAHCATLTLQERLAVIKERPGQSKRELDRLLKGPKPIELQAVAQAEVISAKKEKEPPKSDKKAIKARARKEKEGSS